MKKLLLLAVVIVMVCSSAALALDPMGPPTASLGKGAYSLGVEWAWSQQDIEYRVDSGSSNTRRMLEIDPMNKIYGNIGYGVADNVDVFVRLGAGWVDADRDTDYSYSYNWDMDGDGSFIFGGGVKMTLWEQPGINWGALAQYSWGSFEGEEDGYSPYYGNWRSQDYKLRMDELQIAFGPTWEATEGVSIYGGAFYHGVQGTLEQQRDSSRTRHSIEEESWLGGYIGTSIDVGQNCCVNVDGMFTRDATGLVVALVYRR